MQYKPISACKPSNQIDSPSKNDKCAYDALPMLNRQTIWAGVLSKDKIAPPKHMKQNQPGNNPESTICKELFMMTLTA